MTQFLTVKLKFKSTQAQLTNHSTFQPKKILNEKLNSTAAPQIQPMHQGLDCNESQKQSLIPLDPIPNSQTIVNSTQAQLTNHSTLQPIEILNAKLNFTAAPQIQPMHQGLDCNESQRQSLIPLDPNS